MVTEISLQVMKMFGTWQRWWLYNINVLNAPVGFEMANFMLLHLKKTHKNPSHSSQPSLSSSLPLSRFQLHCRIHPELWEGPLGPWRI